MKTTRRRFYVTSDRRRFPIDMLRYDACWPESQMDSRAIEDPASSRGLDNKTRVTLLSDSASEPERDRWASFGWQVIYVEKIK